jgi:hypothetical protein
MYKNHTVHYCKKCNKVLNFTNNYCIHHKPFYYGLLDWFGFSIKNDSFNP